MITFTAPQPTAMPKPHAMPMTHDRSSTMYALNEALARDRMSEARQRASAERLSRHASAARRWARLERLAASAHARHSQQVRDRSGG